MHAYFGCLFHFYGHFIIVFLAFQKLGKSKDVKVINSIYSSDDDSDAVKPKSDSVKNRSVEVKTDHNLDEEVSEAGPSDKTEPTKVTGKSAISNGKDTSGNGSDEIVDHPDAEKTDSTNASGHKRKMSNERDDGGEGESSKKKKTKRGKKGRQEKVPLRRNMSIYKGSGPDGSTYLYSKDSPNVSIVLKASSV